ncbi:carbon-nitrogen hydrolase family protein [Moorellaceae bacterium AZ2]
MSVYKLSIVQFSPDRTSLTKNLAAMEQYLSQVPADADFILLPEAWLGTTVLPWETYKEVVTSLYARLCCPDALLVGGAQYVRAGQKVYCRGMAFGGTSGVAVTYEKIFPSQAVGERLNVSPGSTLPVLDFRGVRLGIVICVDLFYPELVRSLALRGASLILNPVTVPANRISLWQSIGMTRAAENTVFLAVANNTQILYRDGREVPGQSFLAYPDGCTLLTCGPEPGVYTFTFDLSLITQVRQRWPYLTDVKLNRKKIWGFIPH